MKIAMHQVGEVPPAQVNNTTEINNLQEFITPASLAEAARHLHALAEIIEGSATSRPGEIPEDILAYMVARL